MHHRSTAPELRLQLGSVQTVKTSGPQNPTEFQLELAGGVTHYFRAVSAEGVDRFFFFLKKKNVGVVNDSL